MSVFAPKDPAVLPLGFLWKPYGWAMDQPTAGESVAPTVMLRSSWETKWVQSSRRRRLQSGGEMEWLNMCKDQQMAKTKACQVKGLLHVLATSKEVAVESWWSGVPGAWLRGSKPLTCLLLARWLWTGLVNLPSLIFPTCCCWSIKQYRRGDTVSGWPSAHEPLPTRMVKPKCPIPTSHSDRIC